MQIHRGIYGRKFPPSLIPVNDLTCVQASQQYAGSTTASSQTHSIRICKRQTG